jgi:hypothetical protein
MIDTLERQRIFKMATKNQLNKKINQCKNQEEVNEYFQDQDRKLWKAHGFVYGEMDKIWAYARDRQELLEKCGERLRKIKEAGK